MADVIANADDLHIRITVLGQYDPLNPLANSEDDVTLDNPQRLSLTPHAVWVTHATDFNVQGRMTVNNTNTPSFLTNNLRGRRNADHQPYQLAIQPEALQTVLVGSGPDDQQGALLAINGATDRSLFKAGKLTIDSDDGAGLANLVSGAYKNAASDYRYTSNGQAASRIQMGQGVINLYTSESNGQGQIRAQPVGWGTPSLSLDNNAAWFHGAFSVYDGDNDTQLLSIDPNRQRLKSQFTGGFQLSNATVGSGLWANATLLQLEGDTVNFNGQSIISALGVLNQANFAPNSSTPIAADFRSRAVFNGQVNGSLAMRSYAKRCDNTTTCY